MAETDGKKRTVVFFHPDLGIGGAERLVVDAAVGLQERGHRVVIFTSHCDPKHCFEEARDGTLDVRVRGNYLFPPSILSRLTILCAILRQLHLLVHISFTSELYSLFPASIVVDQLSAGLPLLRYYLPHVPVLFYCHYPDLLLAQGRGSWWKRAYRAPFDAIEAWSMGFAQAVAVNSEFTRGVVRATWPALEGRVDLRVVHPCVALDEVPAKGDVEELVEWKEEKMVLSINRFERKKDVALAIKAFAAIPEARRKGVRLVIAGGYDPRITENVEYHAELVALATSLDLPSITAKTVISALAAPRDTPVLFLLSVPSHLKAALLRSATLLAYTPSNEHFGIVPLEAMLAGVPVLASDSGGPRETVVDGATGWLRDAGDVQQWTAVLDWALNDMSGGMRERMGRAGAERVRAGFGRGSMAGRIEGILRDIDYAGVRGVFASVMTCLVAAAILFVGLYPARALFREALSKND